MYWFIKGHYTFSQKESYDCLWLLYFSKIFRTNSPVLEQINASTFMMQIGCDTTLKYFPPNTPEAQFTLKPAMNKIHVPNTICTLWLLPRYSTTQHPITAFLTYLNYLKRNYEQETICILTFAYCSLH